MGEIRNESLKNLCSGNTENRSVLHWRLNKSVRDKRLITQIFSIDFALKTATVFRQNHSNHPNLPKSFIFLSGIFIIALLCFASPSSFAQISNPSMTTYFAPGTGGASSNNFMKNSAAFRQEIMRMEINVTRGAQTLPITQVPRVQRGDVIKMKLLDEAVGGIRPSDSLWDWTFLVAFVNPNRRAVISETGKSDKGSAVSQEIQFKKTGWYKQYSFPVPYDSQPVFFLYPRPKYRDKILKVVTRNYNEVRKLGEKTIEIAGAYANISSFLNELQFVLHQSQMSRYYNPNPLGNAATNPYSGTTGYSSYGSTGSTYNPYGTSSSTYNPYNPYNPTTPNNTKPTTPPKPDIPFNYNLFVERSIERIARSFNIALPSCWGNGAGGGGFGSSYGNYGSSGSSYGNYGNSNYGSYGSSAGFSSFGYGNNNNLNNFGYAVNQELFMRAQCVAKNIRLEDFDLSVASMIQQGGIMAATYLRDKYPQLAYWINLAAAAIDFIVKVFQKAALRIVPSIVQASDGGSGYSGSGSYSSGSSSSYNSGSYNGGTSPYQTNYATPGGSPGGYTPTASATAPAPVPVKLSLYAESQPDTNEFVTAYPVVVHKWQQEPDPEVISIPPPVLAEPCLHVGVNLLKNTMIGDDPEADTFTKDFKLVMSAANGFKKEFPLKKNSGLGGWELNLTKEDLTAFPKVEMKLDSQITGVRGFNEIKSPVFTLPLSLGGSYEIAPEARKAFAVGGKRIVSIRNPLGGCQCIQAVIYKPDFGGQFVFEANARDRMNQLQYSPDGREVFFEIDATTFQPGGGQLILVTYGGETLTANIELYPLPPNITNVKMARGDSQAIITGERLEQLQSVKINGRRATVVGNTLSGRSGAGTRQNTFVSGNGNGNSGSGGSYNQPNNQSQYGGYPNQPMTQNQTPNYNQNGVYPNQSNNQSNYPAPNSNPNQTPNNYQNNNQPMNSPPNQSVSPDQTNQPNQSMIPPMQTPPNAYNQPNSYPASGNQNTYPNQVNNGSPNAYPNSGNQNGYPNQPPSQTGGNNFYNAATNQTAAQNLDHLSVPLGANERLVVFDDLNNRLTENYIQLELGLGDDRTFPLAKTFPAAASRPAIAVDASREIAAQVVGENGAPSALLSVESLKSLVLPLNTDKLSVSVRNSLTDYDFKVENLSIETRLENSFTATGSGGLTSYSGYIGGSYTGSETVKTTFEVLDWKNLRIDFSITEQTQKMLGGRRIQFRIRDRERGDSDWYTIKQTFVRTPQIEAVRCTNEMAGMCELSGRGVDYIAKVSVDGGLSWSPDGANTLQAKAEENGKMTVMIPHYANKKLLLIKLRDFPQMPGLIIGNYVFTNNVRNLPKSKKTADPAKVESSPTNLPIPKNIPPQDSPKSPAPSSTSPPTATPMQNYPGTMGFPGMPGYVPPKDSSKKENKPPANSTKPSAKSKPVRRTKN